MWCAVLLLFAWFSLPAFAQEEFPIEAGAIHEDTRWAAPYHEEITRPVQFGIISNNDNVFLCLPSDDVYNTDQVGFTGAIQFKNGGVLRGSVMWENYLKPLNDNNAEEDGRFPVQFLADDRYRLEYQTGGDWSLGLALELEHRETHFRPNGEVPTSQGIQKFWHEKALHILYPVYSFHYYDSNGNGGANNPNGNASADPILQNMSEIAGALQVRMGRKFHFLRGLIDVQVEVGAYASVDSNGGKNELSSNSHGFAVVATRVHVLNKQDGRPRILITAKGTFYEFAKHEEGVSEGNSGTMGVVGIHTFHYIGRKGNSLEIVSDFNIPGGRGMNQYVSDHEVTQTLKVLYNFDALPRRRHK